MITPPLSRHHRDRGNVLLLVVVVLSLLALLGGAYLQTARVQRQQFVDVEDCSPQVMDAVIAQISQTLKDDIYNPESGMFFDLAMGTESYDRPWTNVDVSEREVLGVDGTPFAMAVGGRLDDPWLASTTPRLTDGVGNPAVIWPQITSLTGGVYPTTDSDDPAGRRVVKDQSGDNPIPVAANTINNVNAFGNRNLVDADGDGVADSRFERAPIAVKDGVEYFMAVRIVDLASLLNINTALSSVGTSATDFDTSNVGAAAPRGGFAAELNLGALLYDATSVMDSDTLPELEALQALRFDNPAPAGTARYIFDQDPPTRLYDDANPTPFTLETPPAGNDTPFRRAFSLFGANRYGNFDDAFVDLGANIETERELRFRNGALDLLDARPPTEDAAEDLFASHVTDRPAGFDTEALALDFFTFGNTTAPAGAANSGNLRRQLTTRSAEALYAPPIPGVGPTSHARFKVALNSVDVEETREELEDIYSDVFSVNTPPASELPPFAGTNESVALAAARFAASVQDYGDRDNITTRVDVAGATTVESVGGLEAYPFISEIYLQREYTAMGDVVLGDPGTATTAVTWNANQPASAPPAGTGPRQRTDTGYAIELRNPFNQPINLENVWIEIFDGTAGAEVSAFVDNDETDGTQDDLDEIAGDELAAANMGVAGRANNPSTPENELRFLYPEQTLVIYRNSGANPGMAADEDDLANSLFEAPDANQVHAEITSADGTRWPVSSDGSGGTSELPSEVLVRLRTTDISTPTSMPDGFAYATASTHALPDTYVELASNAFNTATGSMPPAMVAMGDSGHLQLYSSGFASTGAAGDPIGLNMLAVKGDDFERELDLDAAAPGETTLNPPRADKGGGASIDDDWGTISETGKRDLANIPPGNMLLANGDGDSPVQILISNALDNRIRSVGEILHVPLIGPRVSTPSGGGVGTAVTIADEWDTTDPAADFHRLFLNPAANTPGGFGPDFPSNPGQRVTVTNPQGGETDILHASMLLGQLSAASVARDGIDSDGRGGVDQTRTTTPTAGNPSVVLQEEQTVLGRLNVNTVDGELLSRVLPFVSPAIRGELTDLIVEERANPRRGFTDPNPVGPPMAIGVGQGIVSLWDYWVDIPLRNAVLDLGRDGMDTQRAAARIDFLGNTRDAAAAGNPPSAGTDDDVFDDREEQTALLSTLESVTTNRSDVFVAYILVHGYRDADGDGNFGNTDVNGEGLIETARSIVLFDRTQLYENTDEVTSEVLFEFPQ